MTQSGGFLRVRNWERYQHYQSGKNSDGAQPWCKLYRSMLTDELALESDATKVVAQGLMMLACTNGNKASHSVAYLAGVIHTSADCSPMVSRRNTEVAIERLIELGFAELVDDQGELLSQQADTENPRMILGHNAKRPRTIRTEQNRTEESGQLDADPALDLVSFEEAWKPWPKKVAKKEAKKAFNKQPERIRSREFHKKTIWPALREQVRAPKWAKDGIFCHFATWYNGARWEDVTAKPGGEAREAIGLRGFDYVEVRNRSLAERQSLRPVAVPALHENRPGEADAGAGGDGAGEAPEHVPEVGNGSTGGNRDPTDAGEVVVR